MVVEQNPKDMIGAIHRTSILGVKDFLNQMWTAKNRSIFNKNT